MQNKIKISVGDTITTEPILIIISNEADNRAEFLSHLKTRINDSAYKYIEYVHNKESVAGDTWHLQAYLKEDDSQAKKKSKKHPKNNNHIEITIISCGSDPLDSISLAKVTKAVDTSIKKIKPKMIQVLCPDVELDEELDLAVDSYFHDSIAQAIAAADYDYDEFKSKKSKNTLKNIHIIKMGASPKDDNPATRDNLAANLAKQEALIGALALTKDLANAPPNLCTPVYLAEQAKALAKQYKNLSCKVIGEKEMRSLGMNAYLAVTEGSAYPPQLIILEHKIRSRKNSRPVILIGKGMTFDTGGVSLKPAGRMDEMKYDMSGAAAVIGVMKFVAEMKVPINLVCMAAAAENSLDGTSYRPGDILETMSGKSVEVLNTDAEGRLVLCDTLSYAQKYSPSCVIDLATLTGACVVALGHHRSGLFGNNDELTAKIEQAADRSQDLVWKLPMDKTYMLDMKTNFADIANVGTGRAAGTITAAGFLAEFADDYHWAHLDIAGTSWLEGKDKGATGRPVRMLTQLILDNIYSI